MSAYLDIIIISAELLHIFIHFFIGHEYEEHQNNNLASFRNLMALELILTLGLAGIIYLEGEVSSKLAVIKGNNLYGNSLRKLTEQNLIWFNDQFAVKLADKFNHVSIHRLRITNRCLLLGTTSSPSTKIVSYLLQPFFLWLPTSKIL